MKGKLYITFLSLFMVSSMYGLTREEAAALTTEQLQQLVVQIKQEMSEIKPKLVNSAGSRKAVIFARAFYNKMLDLRFVEQELKKRSN